MMFYLSRLKKHPKTLILIFFLVIGFCVFAKWAYQKVSASEQQQNVSQTQADLYWFEQTLRNDIGQTQIKLMGAMREVATNQNSIELFQARSNEILGSNPTLVHVSWLRSNGTVFADSKALMPRVTQEPLMRATQEQEGVNRARFNAVSVAVSSFLMSDGDYELTLIQPFFNQDSQLEGFVQSSYSLRSLFARVLPQWFSGKYHSQVTQADTVIFSDTYGESTHFDSTLPVAQRSLRIAGTSFDMSVQMYPSQQEWRLRQFFIGLLFLLLVCIGSLLALVLDRRQRRAVEKELRAQNRLRLTIENSVDVGIRAHAIDGTMFYANDCFLNMIGFEADEVLHLPPPLHYVPKEEGQKLLKMIRDVRANPSTKLYLDLKLRKKTGEILDTIMRGGPMYDDEGNLIGWISTIEDVTERKRLEAFQANEQKRLETINHLLGLGEMASSIAHELNQPLSAISGYATGLANYIQRDDRLLSRERLVEVTEKIRRQAERAANVTRRVQMFSKQKTIEAKSVDLPLFVEEVLGFMELELRQKRCVLTNHTAGMLMTPALVDPTMIQQILINLMRNAIDALVDAQVVHRAIHVYAEPYTADHHIICVKDNGPGVAPDQLDKIFLPFYTTKAQGVGIGLNICRTMIESNGGRLWAVSSPKGGEFYFTVPIFALEVDGFSSK
jgi:two-component system sensor histidine kinase DctS